jgi:hypothetical protein
VTDTTGLSEEGLLKGIDVEVSMGIEGANKNVRY